MKDNWKIVCEKVSTTKNLLEMPFEKGVASLILSGLGWNEFNDNIKEQYIISDHIKEYRVDFALIPKGKEKPEILVELKKTSHRQRKKDIAQIRTYMMLTNCRFCLYFGEKIELFFMDINGVDREMKSVLNLNYDVKNPDGNRLLNEILYESYDANHFQEFCKTRLKLDWAAEYYTKGEGKELIFDMMAEKIGCNKDFAILLASVLTPPQMKEKEIIDDEPDVTPEDTPCIPKETKSVSADGKSNVWLLPSKKKRFDLEGCFNTYGQVYWTMTNNFKQMKKGDTGFIYSSEPDKAIIFSFEVIDCHLRYTPEMDIDNQFSKDPINMEKRRKTKFALIRMTGKSPKHILTLNNLEAHSMKGAPQSAMMISQEKYKDLYDYIVATFNSHNKNEESLIPCSITRNSNAKGLFNPDTCVLTVLKGSKINPNYLPNMKAPAREKRKLQIKENAKTVGDDLVLTKDVVFDSPSGAAKFCIGGAADGWESWTDNEGRAIKVYRKKS